MRTDSGNDLRCGRLVKDLMTAQFRRLYRRNRSRRRERRQIEREGGDEEVEVEEGISNEEEDHCREIIE